MGIFDSLYRVFCIVALVILIPAIAIPIYLIDAIGIIDMSWSYPAEIDVQVVAFCAAECDVNRTADCSVETSPCRQGREYVVKGRYWGARVDEPIGRVTVKLVYNHPSLNSKAGRKAWSAEHASPYKREEWFRDSANYTIVGITNTPLIVH